MSHGVRRHLAILVCRMLQGVLPQQWSGWGWAIRHEVAEIADDGTALLFALHGLCGLAPRIAAFHLLQLLGALTDHARPSGGTITMGLYHTALRHPRAAGVACATGAAMLGLVYMAAAGAPMRYLGVNAGALVVGIGMLAFISGVRIEAQRWSGVMMLIMAMLLLATAFQGDRVEGAARWVALGPLAVQPSLILLPMMIIAFARTRDAMSAAGMIIAAAALAIQPDRAMAAMLAASLAVLAVMRRDRFVMPAFAASIISLTVTLIRADTLPAVPYVYQILYSSFDVHALAGLAVLGGSVLLVVPAIIGRLHDVDNPGVYSVFGIVWLSAILAAAVGNYPTPIVGYGGSAIIGYVLSLAMLPAVIRSCMSAEVTSGTEDDAVHRPDRHLYVGLAYPA